MSCPSLDQFQIGWICALQEEFQAALLMLDESYGMLDNKPAYDNNSYRLWRIGKHNIVIARMVKYGRLGDLVISYPTGTSSAVIQYDLGKEADHFTRTGVLHPPPSSLLAVANDMVDDLEQHGFLRHFQDGLDKYEGSFHSSQTKMSRPSPDTDRLFKDDFEHPVGEKDCRHCPSIHAVSRKRRTIASGNTVIKNARRLEEVRVLTGGALCVEMEAAGMMTGFPCIVNDEWHCYVALVATAFTKEFLLRLSTNTVSEQKLVIDVCEVIREEVQGINVRLDRTLEQQQRHHDATSAQDLIDKLGVSHQRFKSSEYEKFKNDNPEPVAGTCKWIDESYEYKGWRYVRQPLDSLYTVLLISGGPLVAKSVLACYIVDTEMKTTPNPNSICHFFFKSNDEQNTLATALCAILHQLFEQQPQLLHHAKDSTTRNADRIQKETDELWRISRRPLLDGIDHCCSPDRERLLTRIQKFYSADSKFKRIAMVKFLLTSRPNSLLENTLTDSEDPRDPKPPKDSKQLKQHTLLIRMQDSMQEGSPISAYIDIFIKSELEKIQEQLFRQRNRTYLWVHLVVKHIKAVIETHYRPENVSVPMLPASVTATYKQMLEQINEDNISDVAITLQVMIAARSPLTVNQVTVAQHLAVSDPGAPITSDTDYPPNSLLETLPRACGFLVTISENKVDFIHPTAREYLLENGFPFEHQHIAPSSTLVAAETRMAEICIRYLARKAGDWCYGKGTGPVAAYAAANWVDHLKHVPSAQCAHLQGLIDEVYELGCLKGWAPCFYRETRPIEIEPIPLIPIHLACFNGHIEVIKRMIAQEKDNIHWMDSSGTTALINSARKGHLEISRLLVGYGADVYAVSTEHGRKSYVYEEWRHISSSEVMFSASRTGTALGTALGAAYLNGHLNTAKLMLEAGAQNLDSAPMYASYGGDFEAVEFLMSEGADPRALDRSGYFGTTIQAAALSGNIQMLQLMLQNGAEDQTGY
ncbi:hypothetical protein BJX70DRAFT_407383 [Aspergillus crustosus]